MSRLPDYASPRRLPLTERRRPDSARGGVDCRARRRRRPLPPGSFPSPHLQRPCRPPVCLYPRTQALPPSRLSLRVATDVLNSHRSDLLDIYFKHLRDATASMQRRRLHAHRVAFVISQHTGKLRNLCSITTKK